MRQPLAEGRYLLVLEEGETVDDDQAELLALQLERDQPEAVELRLRRELGHACLWRRQIRVIRPGAETLLGKPAREPSTSLEAPIIRQPAATAAFELGEALARLGHDPDDPYALLVAGHAQLAAADPLAACRFLERALRLTPDQPEWRAPVHNALAEAHLACGAPLEAEPHLRASVALVPEQWQGWALIAEHHLSCLRHADVIEVTAHLLEVGHTRLHWDRCPDRASLLAQLGMAELLRHRPSDACRHLRQALDLELADEEQRRTAEKYLGMAERMVARGSMPS